MLLTVLINHIKIKPNFLLTRPLSIAYLSMPLLFASNWLSLLIDKVNSMRGNPSFSPSPVFRITTKSRNLENTKKIVNSFVPFSSHLVNPFFIFFVPFVFSWLNFFGDSKGFPLSLRIASDSYSEKNCASLHSFDEVDSLLPKEIRNEETRFGLPIINE